MENDHQSLEENIDQVFEDHLDRIIEDLKYFKEQMADPLIAKELRKKYKQKIQILEYYGVEFMN
jgi:hypothetical protein